MTPGHYALVFIAFVWLVSRLRDRSARHVHIDEAWQHRRFVKNEIDHRHPNTWRMS